MVYLWQELNFLNTVIAKLVTSNCNTSKGCLDGSLSKTLVVKTYTRWHMLAGWAGMGQATRQPCMRANHEGSLLTACFERFKT